MTLSSCKKIHFIGIGGISMSGLAEILLSKGYEITGSDQKASDETLHLKSIGIKVYIGHSKSNIAADVDLVIYTAAVHDDNVEIQEAKKRDILAIDRAELVGTMMKDYTYPISIAGTHGKTTTTSMLTEIYIADEKNPTASIGGILNSIHGNFKIGGNDYFIVESCEYCDSFLKFNPYAGIILNIDRDHTDYFKDMEQTYASFKKFALKIPQNGILTINNEIPKVNKIIEALNCRVITFGLKNNSLWYADNIKYDSNGNGSYTAMRNNESIGEIRLNVPGEYNILNSLAACATAYELGISFNGIKKGLINFKGTHRRFEYKGKFNNVTVIDDYAHHPTEIKSTISAAKAHNINKLWCVFQPHTYSRTKSLLNEFAEAFDDADNIIVLDIFAAREQDTGEIHSKDLVKKLKERNSNAFYFKTFKEATDFLISNCSENDMLITMGAGDIYLLGETLLKTVLSTISTELSTN